MNKNIHIVCMILSATCHLEMLAQIPDLPSIRNGLVAYYPLNGNANDGSGNSNNGVVSGAAMTTDRFGRTDSALLFDQSDFISVPTSATLDLTTSLSISIWCQFSVDPYSLPDGRYSTVYKPGAWYGLSYWSAGDYFLADITNEEGARTASITWEKDRWYHVVGTYDGAVSRIYVDAQLNGTYSVAKTLSKSSSDLTIGGENWEPGWPAFPGKVDEVFIFNRAITQEEVIALHNVPESRLYQLVTGLGILAFAAIRRLASLDRYVNGTLRDTDLVRAPHF